MVDGKQRLDAIWGFYEGEFPLAPDFKFFGDDSLNEVDNSFKPGMKFSEFTEVQKEHFRNKQLDVVLVVNADEDDIEELFSRLNNGEPLNAAEKRNALGGDMIALIRQFAKHPFFEQKLGFANKRLSHQEVAAKLIRMEMNDKNGSGDFCDLKKKFLDELVRKNKTMSEAEQLGLSNRLSKRLKDMEKVFFHNDPLLSRQSYPQLYYGWVKFITSNYTHETIHKTLHNFLENFQKRRIENLDRPEDERDPTLVEYGRLMQQGTNDLNSMQDRARILTKYLLLDHPEFALLDKNRNFTDEERFVIWMKSGNQCASCETQLLHLDDMEADHKHAWVKGGATDLTNAQALCVPCNKKTGAARRWSFKAD